MIDHALLGGGQAFLLALLVGTIGGIYGIGGGSLLAPILVGLGFSVALALGVRYAVPGLT